LETATDGGPANAGQPGPLPRGAHDGALSNNAAHDDHHAESGMTATHEGNKVFVPDATPMWLETVTATAGNITTRSDIERRDQRMTRTDQPQVSELAEELYRVLSKLFTVLRRGDTSRLATGDLSRAQLSILFALLDRGPLRMNELAAHEHVRNPTTTVAIRLEELGLVKRCGDPSDLRAVLVDITPRGVAVQRESLANRRAVLASMLKRLNDNEVNTLTEALVPLERLKRIGSQTNKPSQSRTAAHCPAVHR
jgi:DNA-binding MarR family transcriptional regulator